MRARTPRPSPAAPGPDGDGWRVERRARPGCRWAGEADLFLVVCKTSDQPGAHADIAIVAVERDARRCLGVLDPYDKAAAAFLPIGEMLLRGCSMPAGRRAGVGHERRAERDRHRARATSRPSPAGCRRRQSTLPCGQRGIATPSATRCSNSRASSGSSPIWRPIWWPHGCWCGHAADLLGSPPRPSGGLPTPSGSAPDAALRAAVDRERGCWAPTVGCTIRAGLPGSSALAKMLQVVDGTAEIQRVVIARELDRRAARL